LPGRRLSLSCQMAMSFLPNGNLRHRPKNGAHGVPAAPAHVTPRPHRGPSGRAGARAPAKARGPRALPALTSRCSRVYSGRRKSLRCCHMARFGARHSVPTSLPGVSRKGVFP
jgi:hypothetical protein